MRKYSSIPPAAARLKYRRVQREQRRLQFIARAAEIARHQEAVAEYLRAKQEQAYARIAAEQPAATPAPIVPAPSRREQSALVWGFIWALLFALVAAQAAAHGSVELTHGAALVLNLSLCIYCFSTWGRLRDSREVPQHTEA